MERVNVILNQDILNKFKIKVTYLMVECSVCKHTWGINIFNNQINPRNLICNDCAAYRIIDKPDD